MSSNKTYTNQIVHNAYTFLFVSTLTLLITTLLTATILSSIYVSADDSVVDKINITVPESCTMSGTGMDSHNTNNNNGTYTPDIGTTTMHVFCNDNEGFAIYAAGYTGDEIGGTNSNKLVGTSASGNAAIESGLATSAGNPDVSNWAMKLAITQDSGDTSEINAFTIDSAPNVSLPSEAEQGATSVSFSSYHVVPNEYTKVAHKNSGTDMTAVTGGVKLTTAYAAYISKTQPADTYSGQVIYTLVHPSSAAAPVGSEQVGVTYNANGSTFVGGATTNRVVYTSFYQPIQYVGNTATIVKSPNILDNGTQNGPYYTNSSIGVLEPITLSGAEEIKVVLRYGLTSNSGAIMIAQGDWDGQDEPSGEYYELYSDNENITGTNTYIFEGDTVTLLMTAWDTPESDYDYGMYAEVYPVYYTEHADSSPIQTEYYMGNMPTIIKTSNIDNDGIKQYSYEPEEHILETIPFAGASKVRAVIRYGLTYESFITIAEGSWGGWDEGDPNGISYDIDTYNDSHVSGVETYDFDGGTVTIEMNSYSVPESDYDYGMYVELYPIYETEQENTSPILFNVVSKVDSLIGEYERPNNWGGSWYANIDDEHYDFMDEAEVVAFIDENMKKLSGTNIELHRGLSFPEAYIRAGKTQENGYYKQQDLNNSICQTVAITQNHVVKDIRDNNTYMIGRLKDGRCWMLDNLALDPTDATTAANMSVSNTNASAEAIQNYLNGGSSVAGWSNVAVVNNTGSWATGVDGYSQPFVNKESKDTLVTSYGPASVDGKAKVGIYYNFCAATVGTYCYARGTNVIIDAEQDVCPANWRIPTGGITGEYTTLFYSRNSVTDMNDAMNSFKYDLSTPLSGVYVSSAYDQDSFGHYWSSSFNYGYDSHGIWMYGLSVLPNDLWLSSDVIRDYGLSIRCLVSN